MMERAKELFYQYHGNRFYMDHDGVGWEYDKYHISKETEDKWTEELFSRFMEGNMRGREALRVYSAAADLLSRARHKEAWEACLYYPLRADHLDDVTILYLLPCSFRMAEKAARARHFPAEEAESYRRELACYVQEVRVRAESGTLKRAEDYTAQEFSDSIYMEGYLSDIISKWDQLLKRRL